MVSKTRKIRYAVVGLGHITQAAMLPSFHHAAKNSVLAALVSDDPTKLTELGKMYDVEHLYSYDDFEKCLKEAEIDAVYIALPNKFHCDYTVRAANLGVHVLCEKPMAMNSRECYDMIEATEKNGVKLMIAYRLHFEEANMKVVEFLADKKIGEPRFFSSTFSQQVVEGNIRTDKELGGGPLQDIGIYCINAARYLFKSEPLEITALAASINEKRFEEVDEMVGAVMRFPDDRLASFICSFGATSRSRYEVVGTEGHVVMDPAYDYAEQLKYELVAGKKHLEKELPLRDQFAPQLLHFSDCIINDAEIQASGYEGFADMRVIEAINESLRTGQSVKLDAMEMPQRPGLAQVVKKPAVGTPKLVHADAPSS